jgi:16S rRNA (adenine1518-N6/adenine1519-N6)-dimethyltransferase
MKARKRFGQNFLHDPQLIAKIISAINPRQDDRIVEVGPGRGAITMPLVDSKCDLTVIEIDRDLAAQLRHLYPNTKLIEADVLKFDFAELGEGIRVVGNLPYNISTPLMFKLFEHYHRIIDMHFMLQLEVVERLVAVPNSEHYGRLSIMSQYYCDAQLLFKVPPEAFIPQPKVTSAIVRLQPKQERTLATNETRFANLVNQAFSMRRKTLRNALKGFVTAEDLEHLDIDPMRRPETLSLDDFIHIANIDTKQ